MITFREVDDADPALAFSPMARGVEKTFAWIGEHGGIPLTPSKAFKRIFVHWAAGEFDWPGQTEADLFAVNKVPNEPDFAPLMVLHDLMIAMKLEQHFKGEFCLTKSGQAQVSDAFIIYWRSDAVSPSEGQRLPRNIIHFVSFAESSHHTRCIESELNSLRLNYLRLQSFNWNGDEDSFIPIPDREITSRNAVHLTIDR